MQTQLMFSQADSPANHTAQPGSDLEKKTNAIYGRRCLEQLEKLPRVTSWAKTFAGLLIGTGDWYSMRCALTWKILGIKSRPILYLHARQMPHINESEFGLWPTPCARDTQGPQAQELKKFRNEQYTMKIESVPGRIREITGVIGQNNPMFYLEMMGYPSDWTIEPFLKLEENQLRQQVTL